MLVSGDNRGKFEANLLYVESESDFGATAGKSFQYSSHVGALNLIDESKSLPVEANNSTIELHLAVEAKEKLSEYIESKSLPVEVKENFAIVNSKYESLVEANHFQTRASRQILSRFHPWRASIRPFSRILFRPLNPKKTSQAQH